MLNHEVVNHWSNHITKEDSQHHSLGITGIHYADDDSHSTDDESVDILTRCGAARGDGVGCHKHSTESKATHHEMMPPNHRLTSLLEDKSQDSTTDEDTQHSAPRGNAHPEQENGTNGNGDDTGLTD